MSSHFTPATLKFLRGLARHNDREWFEPRRPVFEAELKAPMLALIEELNHGLAAFAPDHIRPPHKTMFRFYRDTRFSHDKRPYKDHIAAWFARRGMEKTSGAGFYFHLSAKELLIAIGVFMPQPEQLLAIRRAIADNPAEYRALLKKLMKPSGSKVPFTPVEPDALKRVPKGFSADHPAADLLVARNFGVHVILPTDVALSPTLGKEILQRFCAAAPLTEFLNNAINASPNTTSSPRETPLDKPRPRLF